ncbi:FAD-dependent oxidoreductase [uncultured Brachyspira sp.]|uniref:FAD-dependent oxidoreductase n=1 Tax=uncultured Brachyspira sp. TaxID=221953 RepID=UPI00263960E6|nr:FAD-dependent oxidoreductase [uncultured Brachyspira sp.]
MKVIVIGCNHAGTWAAKTLKATDPNCQVVTYDRNDNISFLACGIALWVGGVVKDPKGLFYASPEGLKSEGIDVYMGHEVMKIDWANKKLTVKELATGKEFEDNYDKLILATGSWPVTPPIEGLKQEGTKYGLKEGIFFSKLYQQGQEIIDEIAKPEVKKVMVVGAGYIGVELIEAFKNHGKEVILMEAMPRVMANYFDKEITDEAEKRIKEAGIEMHLGETVKKFEGEGRVKKVVTDKGSYDVDMVVMSVGFKPNSELYKDYLETLPNGAIVVDTTMKSSKDDNVYAIGDCASVYSCSSKSNEYIALATNAVRMGIVAANNVLGKKVNYCGTQGSNAICVFGYNMASTGWSEETAKKKGLKVKSNFFKDAERPEFMPSYEDVLVKIVYMEDTGRIVGAQIASKHNHAEAIHAFSLAIANEMTVQDFALSDFFFLPHYNKPLSWMTMVAYTAK